MARRAIMQNFEGIDDINFECYWTGARAEGRLPPVTIKLKAMSLDELIAEAAVKEPPQHIQRKIDWIRKGKWRKSKCPGCAKGQVAERLREWLAEEDAKHGTENL